MAYAIKQYVGDNTTVDFTITFDYISPDYISVLVAGVKQDKDSDYTINSTILSLTVSPLLGVEITIRRSTPRYYPLVSYVDASILTAGDLNLAQTQLLHVMQENTDSVNSGATTAGEALSNALAATTLAQQLGATLQSHITNTNIHSGGTSGSGGSGLIWRGLWSFLTLYHLNDVVSYDGSTYIAIQEHTNQAPTVGAYWNLLADKGDTEVEGVVVGEANLLNRASETIPTPSEGITMFADRSSGVPVIEYKDAQGIVHSMSDDLSTRQFRRYIPTGIGNVSSFDQMVGSSGSFNAEASALNTALGGVNGLRTVLHRTYATANGWGGRRMQYMGIAATSGIKLTTTFVYTSTVRTTNQRYLLGLVKDDINLSSSFPPQAVLASVNTVGLAMAPGRTNLVVFANGASKGPEHDLGDNFPVLDAGGLAGYRLTIHKQPDVNDQYHYKVERLLTNHVATGVLTGSPGTTLPPTSAVFNYAQLLSNGSLGGDMAMEIGDISIELFI